MHIRSVINANDVALAAQMAEPEEEEGEQFQVPQRHQNRAPLSLLNIYLGAPQKPCSLHNLQENHKFNPAFKNFTKRLQSFLSVQPDAGKDVAQEVHSLIMVCYTRNSCLLKFHFHNPVTGHRVPFLEGIL
jgi:hypothetical protein